MSYYLTLLKLREIISHKPIEIIQKSRVYLRPGEKPPKGIVVSRGPNGGVYYNTRSHSPKHAYDEINIAETYSELDNTAAFTKQYILNELGQTKEAYTHIRNIERSLPKVKKILENTEEKTVRQIQREIDDVFKDLNESDMGYGWSFPSIIQGSLMKPAGRREHLKDKHTSDNKLIWDIYPRNRPDKTIIKQFKRLQNIQEGKDVLEIPTRYKTLSSKSTKDSRGDRLKGPYRIGSYRHRNMHMNISKRKPRDDEIKAFEAKMAKWKRRYKI